MRGDRSPSFHGRQRGRSRSMLASNRSLHRDDDETRDDCSPASYSAAPKVLSKTLREFQFFSKFRTAIYSSNFASIGVIIWENAFQTIPNISFFDVKHFLSRFFFGLAHHFSTFLSRFGGATTQRT